MVLLLALLLAPALAQAQTPIGTWRTFDDHTGRERGLVAIAARDGALTGTILATADPEEGRHVCDKCTDDRRGHPIIGLTVLEGLRPDGDSWTGGHILDPETGEVYRCLLRLADDGRKLIVRGYLGTPLIGRTQTWLRAQ